jgi:hypothetical protein
MKTEKLEHYLADNTHVNYALHVDIANQCCYLLDRDLSRINCYAVSTSILPPSNLKDSFGTPSGLHKICECIGGDQPIGMRFVGRTPTGELVPIETQKPAEGSRDDYVLSRILWLAGLEPGINQGSNVDTFQRYIYFHGTNEEYLIGSTASHGCIRMVNADVVALFELVEPDTPVLICID